MTRQEAMDKLKDILINSRGEDEDHSQADQVLCDLLISMGYVDVIIEYNKIDKWFS